jgi:CheY-like chemotaxis protein
VARVLALVPDLLFGSKVQSMLAGAGHEVELAGSPAQAAERIAGRDVLVVDLTTGDIDGAAVLAGLPAGVRTLAFYSHVEADVRAAAVEAGFDLVVPRSRMAREGGQLVSGLADGGSRDDRRPPPGA